MGRFHSYINSASDILALYRGEEPFAGFLRKYFSAHKKFGGNDRKQVTHLCYCYFRAAHIFKADTAEEQLLKSLLICADNEEPVLEAIRPEWNKLVNLPVQEKCKYAGISFTELTFFPFHDELSDGVVPGEFGQSLLVQPDLFLRIRPGYKDPVTGKLEKAGCRYKLAGNDCIILPNGTKADAVLELNKEVVVQDFSSQRVGEFLLLLKELVAKRPIAIWDCCAASGGKSILAKDVLGDITLTVSDIRESILVNLRKRLAAAGIKNYTSFIADLSAVTPVVKGLSPDVVLADVPCSGSGTWARTPEQLYYFERDSIAKYAALQRQIVTHTTARLLPGGYMLYITCSVFKKENEENIAWIKENLHLQLVKMEVLTGYNNRADTMFVALLKKPL